MSDADIPCTTLDPASICDAGSSSVNGPGQSPDPAPILVPNPAPGQTANPAPIPVAARRDIATILMRRDFIAASKAERWSTPGLVMQARRRAPEEPMGAGPRVGFTCSKKVGNAVARNRAKRRLRAAVDLTMPGRALPGWDYVLIGLHEATAARPLPDLCADLAAALDVLHAGRGRKAGPPRPRGKGAKPKAGVHGRGKGEAGAAPKTR
ncbi:MAG: ribonuclease P protein component [Paracoccaceae bacterium]|jgi:ribonuclease P protein component